MVLSIADADSKTKKTITCPYCKGPVFSRVKRGFIVKTLFFWLPLKRYSCHKCKRRPYIWQR